MNHRIIFGKNFHDSVTGDLSLPLFREQNSEGKKLLERED